eukprot:m.127396 g.127396  ORF g.127396 m.127396 type:complete len:82 (-) comp13008_c0_seq1:2707-2952(-)
MIQYWNNHCVFNLISLIEALKIYNTIHVHVTVSLLLLLLARLEVVDERLEDRLDLICCKNTHESVNVPLSVTLENGHVMFP